MAVFENFPYSDLHNLNLDFILKKLKEIVTEQIQLGADYVALKEYVDNYFDSLDVTQQIKDELQVLIDDGTIADLINQTIFNDLKTQLDDTTIKNEELYFADGVPDQLYLLPLAVIKYYEGGLSGTVCSLQGVTHITDNTGNLTNILMWADRNGASRLYNFTIGSRTDGTGWGYTYSDNVPQMHGSTISYYDGIVYISGEQNPGYVYAYNMLQDSYVTIDLRHITNTQILGIAYDEETETFLLCYDTNSTMAVTDKNFNVIRTYTHEFEYPSSNQLLLQGYYYAHGLEYRVITYANSNGLWIFSTQNGKLLKMCSMPGFTGEAESITIHDSKAYILANNVNYDNSTIQFNYLFECYINANDNTDIMEYIQTHNAILAANVCPAVPGKYYINQTIQILNDHADTELIRYVGVGNVANPVKSVSACLTLLSIVKAFASTLEITLNFRAGSTNTDDTSIIYAANFIDKLTIKGNNTNIGGIVLANQTGPVIINGVNITSGATRIGSGLINIDRCNNVEFKDNASSISGQFNIFDCNRVFAFVNVTGTGTCNLSRSVVPSVTLSRMTSSGTVNTYDNVS